jgi:hypothetical protein
MEHWITSISAVSMLLCGGLAVILGVVWLCSALGSVPSACAEDLKKSNRVGLIALGLGALAAVQFYLVASVAFRDF